MAIKDEETKFTLASTDGVKVEVEAFYLKAHSHVFRDMLSLHIASRPPSDMKKPNVDIALNGGNLKILVAYLTDDSSKAATPLSFGAVSQMVTVCDQFGLNNVAARLLNSSFSIYNNAWECFCLASKHDQYHLAKGAVAKMYEGFMSLDSSHDWRTYPLSRISTDMIRQADQGYIGELLLAIGREMQGRREMDAAAWRRVAEDFQRP